MRYLCEAYTTGGPVLILQSQHLAQWDGKVNYFKAVNQSLSDSLQFLIDGNATACLFHQESDGNFHIWYDCNTLLVLSEIYADEGYELRRRLPSIEQSITDKPPKKLHPFGGKVAVFDAAIPGSAVRLREVGCERVQIRGERKPYRYDAALADVAIGLWDAFELYCEEEHVSFSGVLFRLKDDQGQFTEAREPCRVTE
jgi:hypothetical protein